MVTKVKCNCTNGLHIILSLMFNSNIWPNSTPLRDIMLQNLSNFDCGLQCQMWCLLDSPFMVSY